MEQNYVSYMHCLLPCRVIIIQEIKTLKQTEIYCNESQTG